MAKRKKYSEEFKREAVSLSRQPHANTSQVARDIGVNPSMLWRWHRECPTGSKPWMRNVGNQVGLRD